MARESSNMAIDYPFGQYDSGNGNYSLIKKEGGRQEIYESGVKVGDVLHSGEIDTIVDTAIGSLTQQNIPNGVSFLASTARPSYMNRALPVDFNIIRINKYYHTDIIAKLDAIKPSGKGYYIDVENGIDTNDGLSETTAFKTFEHAFGLGDGVVFNISTGDSYLERTQWDASLNNNFDSDIYIKGYGDKKPRAIVGDVPGNGGNPDWALEATYTYTYSIKTDGTLSNAHKILDPYGVDEYGDPREYTKVASIALVEATQGSFYKNGQELYVHGFNSEVVTGDIAIPLLGSSPVIKSTVTTANNTIFLENMSFIGGNANAILTNNETTSPETNVFVNIDCDFHCAHNQDSVQVLGYNSYSVRANASKAGDRDIFNYHESAGGYSAVVVEIEVTAKKAANVIGGTNDNCSTAHEDYEVYRVEGSYYDAPGPVVVDINTCRTWMLGGFAENSGVDETIRIGDGSGGNAYMTLDGVLGVEKSKWIKGGDGTLTINNTNDSYLKATKTPIKYKR